MPELSHQSLVFGPVKILTGLLIHVNLVVRHPLSAQGDELPVLVLVCAGNADIPILQ